MTKHADTVLAAVASSDANSALIGSWRRSARSHGLDPDRWTPPDRDQRALQDGLERDAVMIATADSYLDDLYGALNESEALACIADRTGLVLAQRTARSRDAWSRRADKTLGSRYCEADLGTCPIGTCLAEERPIVVGTGQSFLTKLRHITGVAAPIFGSDGQIAGALACVMHRDADVPPTPLSVSRDTFILMTVSSFARRIGIEMFARGFPKTRLFQVDPALPCAVLAVAPDDRIVGATRGARRLLDLDASRLTGVARLADLFGDAEADDLAGAEARLIAQTMARHGDNRSLAAKALGISRSTLYRKLADPRSR